MKKKRVLLFTVSLMLASCFVRSCSANLSNDTKLALEHLSCSFDSYSQPCQWFHFRPLGHGLKEASLQKGEVRSYKWYSYSMWRHVGLSLRSRKYRLFSGRLLLTIFIYFQPKKLHFRRALKAKLSTKAIESTTAKSHTKPNSANSNLNSTSVAHSKNFKDNFEKDEEETLKDIRNKVPPDFRNIANTKATFPDSRISRKRGSSNVLKIDFHEFRSPMFHMAKQGCIKFKLGSDNFLSKSDNFQLWLAKNGNRANSTLLWSRYGRIGHNGREYIIDLMPGNHRLIFNGSVYIVPAHGFSRLLFPYELDDILVSVNSCKPFGFWMRRDLNKTQCSGSYLTGTSPHSNTKCHWIAFYFNKAPFVTASLENRTLSKLFTTKVTYAAKNGFNCCVQKKSQRTVGWKTSNMRVKWVAYISQTILGKESEFVSNFMQSAEVTAKPFRKPIFQREVGSDTTVPKCPATHFTCSSSQCVPRARVCDDIIDCVDRDDERNCSGYGSVIFLVCFGVAVIVFLSLAAYYCVSKRTRRSHANHDNVQLLPKFLPAPIPQEIELQQIISEQNPEEASNEVLN